MSVPPVGLSGGHIFSGEKIMLLTSDEIPYAVESQVDFLDEQEDIIRINATIYVERESQNPSSLVPTDR